MKEMKRNEDLLVLNSIIANDAISRLNVVEKNFEMSEFLASTDDSFSSWKGGSGFMRIGFGISDYQTFSKACQYSNGAIIGSAFIKYLSCQGPLLSDSNITFLFFGARRGVRNA